MNDLELVKDWYQDLLLDIKKLEFTGIVLTKHAIGKRILLDFEKFGKPEYGSKGVVNIADDLGMSRADLYSCIQFAKQYPELSNSVRQSSWHQIRQKFLPSPRPEKETIPPIPQDDYDVIAIDPPWPVEWIYRDVRLTQNLVGNPYPSMTEQEIENIEIPANDNCHLFLWTVQKFVPLSLQFISNWGFRYVLIFTWHKPGGFQPYGLPQFNSEFVIYARKGTPKFIDTKSFFACFSAPRGKHSEKPACFYETIARVTEGKRLDMFARKRHPGWDSWGNEIEGKIPEFDWEGPQEVREKAVVEIPIF